MSSAEADWLTCCWTCLWSFRWDSASAASGSLTRPPADLRPSPMVVSGVGATQAWGLLPDSCW